MTRSQLLPTFAILGVLGLAGCGGGGGDDDGNSRPAAKDAPALGATGEAAPRNDDGSVAIAMKQVAFTPNAVTVAPGQKITWSSKDSIQKYKLRSYKGEDFKSDTIGRRGTYSFTPKKEGLISYECTLHPGMVGTITVVK